MANNDVVVAVYKLAFGGELPDPRSSIDFRIKLQKLAYIAQNILNVELGLSFNMYLYGPYSPRLADIYHSENFREMVKGAEILEELAPLGDALSKLAGKDARWLEIVTTYFDVKRNAGGDEDGAVATTARIKGVSEDCVREFVGEAEAILGPVMKTS